MFTYFPNTNMQNRKVITLLSVAILSSCMAFALGYWGGLGMKELQWCKDYMGTSSIRECAELQKIPRPV